MLKKISAMVFVILVTTSQVRAETPQVKLSSTPAEMAPSINKVIDDKGSRIIIETASIDVGVDAKGNLLIDGQVALKGDKWKLVGTIERGGM